MLVNHLQLSRNKKRRMGGFSLEEVVTAMSLSAVCFVGTVKGYNLASERAEWAACSLAAQSLAFQRLEQVKAAKWDTMAYPSVDQLVSGNFPPLADTLDMPLVNSSNGVGATVYTTITTLSPTLRTVQVDCVWTNRGKGVWTNSIVSYRSPIQ